MQYKSKKFVMRKKRIIKIFLRLYFILWMLKGDEGNISKENVLFLHGNDLRIDEKMYRPDIPLIPCCFVVRWVVSKSEAGEPLVDAHAHLQVVGKS